jgi:riboflavin synthase
MFTGLIQGIGKLQQISDSAEGKQLSIHCPTLIEDIHVDDSIAVNGVCLTATACDAQGFTAHAIHTTLDKTTLGQLKSGECVNLELAMRASDRLGGHLVQGHVNAIGRISSIDPRGNNWQIHVDFPVYLRRYMIAEGSITLDGISLTIAALSDNQLMVSIIPHTLSHTTLHQKTVGDAVNIEVDIMAKYIENFLLADPGLAKAWSRLEMTP